MEELYVSRQYCRFQIERCLISKDFKDWLLKTVITNEENSLEEPSCLVVYLVRSVISYDVLTVMRNSR